MMRRWDLQPPTASRQCTAIADKQRRRGGALVELLILAPVMLFFLWIIVDFGRILPFYIQLEIAAQAGAQYAEQHWRLPAGWEPGDSLWSNETAEKAAIRAAAVAAVNLNPSLAAGDVDVTMVCECPPDLSASEPTCSDRSDDSCGEGNGYPWIMIRVRVQKDFSVATPFMQRFMQPFLQDNPPAKEVTYRVD